MQFQNLPVKYLEFVNIILKNNITIHYNIKKELKIKRQDLIARFLKKQLEDHYSKIKNVDLKFDIPTLKKDMESKTTLLMAKTFNDIIRLGDGATGSFATIDIQQIRGTATQIDDFNSASLALIGAGRADSNPSAEQGVGKRAFGHIVATSGSLTESPRYYVYHNSSSGDINLSGSEWTTLTNWKEIALETTDVTFNQITSSGNISASGTITANAFSSRVGRIGCFNS